MMSLTTTLCVFLSPHFIFPVFNGGNYFIMYSQFQETHFMMTFLDGNAMQNAVCCDIAT